jgi:AraC-like DNA-binding protein
MSIESSIKNLIPLNSVELDFKKLYSKYSSHALYSPHTLEEAKSILNSLHTGNISSALKFLSTLDDFLPESFNHLPSGSDIAVVKHRRYLPPLLHSHAFIEILYVLRGHCSHTIKDNTFTMSAGDICIVSPDVRHTLFVKDDDSIILNILVRRSTFDTAFFGLFSEKDVIADFFIRILYGNQSNPYIIFETRNNEKIQSLMIDMLSEFEENKEYSSRFMNTYLMLLCLHILRGHEKNALVLNPDPGIQDENIVLILRYIHNNYNAVNLFGLAKMFSYSEAYFSRLIKAYTGSTFSDIIRSIRIRKAADLLLNPNISIEEIVETVGYSDTSHFYRSFKKYYGMTPIDYRNKEAGGQ